MRRSLRGAICTAIYTAGTFAGAVSQAQADRVPVPVPKPAISLHRSAVALSALTPLSQRDVVTYRRIFALQRDGNWTAATALVRRLENRMLLGHVRFQRLMHPTDYRSSFDELRQWMRRYNDHPGAYRVYRLARLRQPDGWEAPPLPVYGLEHLSGFLSVTPVKKSKATRQQRQIIALIRDMIHGGKLIAAQRALQTEVLTSSSRAQLQARLALAYLMRKKPLRALGIASAVAEHSRDSTSLPDWVSGLAAYECNQFGRAAYHFVLHAQSSHAGNWNVSAGAYWAARALARHGQVQEANRWLVQAATHPTTFYGQLALAKLGSEGAIDWTVPSISQSDIATVAQLGGGRRAFALWQLGEIEAADAELLQHLTDAPPRLARAITTVATALRLPQTAVRGGYSQAVENGNFAAAALYPLPAWQPQGGFTMDRALIWAFVRQESAFDPRATSHAGARGLMQLMPSTANYIADTNRFQGKKRYELYEPAVSLNLGQRYLSYLMQKPNIGKNLFRLAIAYNAGGGNLVRWQAVGWIDDDPLMSIETLPFLETRLFVERVMANYWLYRTRLGQTTPSRAALVNNRWPNYVRMDKDDVEIPEGVYLAH